MGCSRLSRIAIWASLATTCVSLASTEPNVVLLRPADGAMLIGPVEIAFLPQGIEDADVRSASVTIDGREVALVSEPPWRATVDVGEAIVARRIEVTLTLADGRSLRAGRTYPAAAAIQRVDVRLVNLSVNVADRRGNPLPGLGREAFTVFDQGVPVPIERFSAQPDGLSIALVIDASGSMLGDRLDAARDAAAAFVEQLADEDRVAVVRFSDDVQTVAALGTNRETAAAAVRGLTSSGGTALHDAIVRTAEELARSEAESRRAIVLLSDGRDEAASGLEPGSFHTLDEAIRAAHLADVEIYALGIGAQLDIETDFVGRLTTREVLERLALSTGGRYERVRSLGRLRRSFETILDELRAQYSMAYTPPPPRAGETWRTVQVRVDVPGATARTREGYFLR